MKRICLFMLLCLCWLCHDVIASDSISEPRRPRVGLVLSGGGAKGIAHVGALKVIEEAGIPIDYIGGTSMGSIIGGLYALGYTATQLEEYVTITNWDALLSSRITRRHVSIYEKAERKRYWIQFPFKERKIEFPLGILSGQNVSNLFTELSSPAYQEFDFTQFPTPFYCVATDIASGKEVVVEHGNVAKAMRASMAIPSLFTPVEIDGRYLYDGGLTNNFPVDIMKEKGIDIIIGVDVSEQPDAKTDLSNIFKVMEQTVFMASLPLKEANKGLCQILIIPQIPEYGATSFGNADSLVVRGERAARQQWDKLKALSDSLKRIDAEVIPKEHKMCPQPLHSFYVTDVKINGLNHISNEYVLQRLEFDVPSSVTFDELNKAIGYLQGTQSFESIVYQLNPLSGDAVELQLDCIERESNMIKAGFHYDNDYKASLLLNLTLRNAIMDNSKATADFSLGENPGFKLSFFQSPSLKPTGKSLFKSLVSPDWQFQIDAYQLGAYTYSGNQRISSYNFSSLAVSLDLSISPSINNLVGGGIVGDYMAISSKVSGESLKSGYLYLTYRLFMEHDSYNEDFFPTEGNKIRIEGTYNKGLSKNVRYSDGLTGVMFHSNFAFTPIKRWTVLLGGSAGAIFGSNVPPQYLTYLGGTSYREIRGNLRFVGMNFMQKSAKNGWVAHWNNQVRLWNNIYVVFRTNIGKTDDDFKEVFQLNNMYFGYGISGQYNTLVGPVGFTLGSSNVTKSLIGSINIGFWF